MQDVQVTVTFIDVPDEIDPRVFERWVFDEIIDNSNWRNLEIAVGKEITDLPEIDLC